MTVVFAERSEPSPHGIMIIDKPEGCSSAKAVSKLKKISWIKKVGHTGTLDPFATGVMICGINNGTRLSQFFLKGDKTYLAELILGAETDTQDATGTIVSNYSGELNTFSDETVKNAVAAFIGKQQQLPPVYSALKHHGKPLYKLAREGKPVQKPARDITIYDIRMIEINMPSVWLEIACSSGTYIRTLCHDIGQKLGCGAHLKTLRRTESCGFSVEKAVPLTDIISLEEADVLKDRLIGMSRALKDMPEHIADTILEEKIRHGKTLHKNTNGPIKNDGQKYVKVVNKSDKLLAILTDAKDCDHYKYCCVFHT